MVVNIPTILVYIAWKILQKNLDLKIEEFRQLNIEV